MNDCIGCPRFEDKKEVIAKCEVDRTRAVNIAAGTAQLIFEATSSDLPPEVEKRVLESHDGYKEQALDYAGDGKKNLISFLAAFPSLSDRYFKAINKIDGTQQLYEDQIAQLQETCTGPELRSFESPFEVDGPPQPTIQCTTKWRGPSASS